MSSSMIKDGRKKTSEYHRNATRKDFLVVSGKSEMVLLHHKNQCSSMAGNKGIPWEFRKRKNG